MALVRQLAWCFVTIGLLQSVQGGGGSESKDIRLPKSIAPEHYYIGIVPNLDTNDLEGFVRMDFFVQSTTDKIVMHGVKLAVAEGSVSVSPLRAIKKNELKESKPSSAFDVINIAYDPLKEFITIRLGSEMSANTRYRLSLNYTGTMSKNLKGIYRSDYVQKSTQTRKMLAVTQFEPTSARLAFPCLDEPAMKATFTISIGRRTNYSSLSNMPLRLTEPMPNRDGWFWDVYDKSVPMSTYLVACVVSDFISNHGVPVVRPVQSSSGEKVAGTIDVRVWARREAIHQTDLAANVTTPMLQFLEDYFQVPFPLPKVDLIGLPDFSSGAMENWGLITYRETTLLVDPKSASIRDEMNVERVIAHELAHQWFGNLVTMEWWNDLWLNEGFATYVQRLVLDNVSPKYQYGTQQTLNFLSVMEADSLDSSHSISVEVQNPTQITEIFDSISYTKGAAVIRMMNHFIGEKTFRRGVTNYLNEKKFGNARQDELWQFLTEQAHADSVLPAGVTIKDIMDTWTLQMGFPLVTIERNYTGKSIFVQQERFLRGAAAMKKDQNNATKPEGESHFPHYRWWVPVSFTDSFTKDFSENNTSPLVWLTPKKLSATRRVRTLENEWILANVLGTGYYRVNYDQRNWQLLDLQLKSNHQAIDPINRACLVDDAFALASAQILPYTTAFSLIEYLANEEHYVPWSSALKGLGYIGRMFSHTKDHGRYKSFMLSLIAPIYRRVGEEFKPGDDHITKMIRISMTNQACNQEYRPCIKKSQNLFDQWMLNPLNFDGIHPDLKSTVYCTAIKYGGKHEWDFAWKMLSNVTSAQHRDLLLSALGCTREPGILIRYLSMVLDPTSGVRKQDGLRVVGAVAGNPAGRRIAFHFIMKHFEEMFTYFGNPVRVLQMLSSSTSGLNTPDDLTTLKRFMDSKASLLQSAQTSSNNIQSVVAANIQWMDNNYGILNDWFATKGFW